MSITTTIRKRRSIYPLMYKNLDIDDSILLEILDNANCAPTHKLTQPWRFKIYKGDKKNALGDFLAAEFEKTASSENYSDLKKEKIREKSYLSACVVAICMQRDESERVPENEEIAAMAMAVQNMWLTCTEKGIGGYWGSATGLLTNIDSIVPLLNGEKCYGFFYMGYSDILLPTPKLKPLNDVITWM